MSKLPKHLILVHGAWVGPWVWVALEAELIKHGYTVDALALPGDGTHAIKPEAATFSDFLDTVSAAINKAPGNVILVGHSGGGMLVTAAAEAFPGKVSRAIWIAGMLIPDGRSFDEIQRDQDGLDEHFGVTQHIVRSEDGRTCHVPAEIARRHFLNDASPELVEQVIANLTRQPTIGHRLSTPTTGDFARLKKLYVVLGDDCSVNPVLQRRMAASTRSLTIVELKAGHMAQLTQPTRLASIIHRWSVES